MNIASTMADGDSPPQPDSGDGDDGSQTDYHDEAQIRQRFGDMQQELESRGLIGGDIPEEPLARFNYLNGHAIWYSGRFAGDGSCLEEALSYYDQAKAVIPSHLENSLFNDDPDVDCFGNGYVHLRVYAWLEAKNLQNAQRLVDAIEWKFNVTQGPRSLDDLGLLALSKTGIYRHTKDAEDRARALQGCQDFIEAVSTLQDLAEELYPSVVSCLSQLLYHEFRSSGKYRLLELSIKLGDHVFVQVPEDECIHLASSLVLAFIAYSFHQRIWDAPRSKQPVLDWSFIEEEDIPPTVPEISTLHLDPGKALYDELPLAPDNSQIRLLQLKSGVADEPVTCFLEVVDLEGCPEYDVSNLCETPPAVCDN